MKNENKNVPPLNSVCGAVCRRVEKQRTGKTTSKRGDGNNFNERLPPTDELVRLFCFCRLAEIIFLFLVFPRVVVLMLISEGA